MKTDPLTVKWSEKYGNITADTKHSRELLFIFQKFNSFIDYFKYFTNHVCRLAHLSCSHFGPAILFKSTLLCLLGYIILEVISFHV